jgi:hypothetical protein
MTDREFEQRLQALESRVQGEHTICPSCGRGGGLTFHTERVQEDGTLAYDPPLPHGCDVCAAWPAERRPGRLLLITGAKAERPVEN